MTPITTAFVAAANQQFALLHALESLVAFTKGLVDSQQPPPLGSQEHLRLARLWLVVANAEELIGEVKCAEGLNAS